MSLQFKQSDSQQVYLTLVPHTLLFSHSLQMFGYHSKDHSGHEHCETIKRSLKPHIDCRIKKLFEVFLKLFHFLWRMPLLHNQYEAPVDDLIAPQCEIHRVQECMERDPTIQLHFLQVDFDELLLLLIDCEYESISIEGSVLLSDTVIASPGVELVIDRSQEIVVSQLNGSFFLCFPDSSLQQSFTCFLFSSWEANFTRVDIFGVVGSLQQQDLNLLQSSPFLHMQDQGHCALQMGAYLSVIRVFIRKS